MTKLRKIGFGAVFIFLLFLTARIVQQFNIVANPTTVAFVFLMIVVSAALLAGVEVAIATSIAATLFYNFYFLPPIGTFRIAEVDNAVALVAFLLTAILIGRLTATSRRHSLESENVRLTLARLKEFGTWLLEVPREAITLSAITQNALQIFSLQYCSLHVFTEGRWHHVSGNAHTVFPQRIEESLQFTEDHRTSMMQLVDEHALGVRYVEIQRCTQPFALLVVKSDYLPNDAVATIAYMVGARLVDVMDFRLQNVG